MSFRHARFETQCRVTLIAAVAGTIALAVPRAGWAQNAAPTAAENPASPPAAAPAVDQVHVGFTAHDAERAHFNFGRYAVEVLTSAAGGALVSYGTFTAVCGGKPCFEGAMAGAGVDMVATPFITMGVGSLMGGRGDFWWTATAGLAGLTATASIQDPMAALGVSLALMPILAPLGYEFTSNTEAKRMEKQLGVARLTPVLVPLRRGQEITGAMGAIQATF
jgi:hypothetical protein